MLWLKDTPKTENWTDLSENANDLQGRLNPNHIHDAKTLAVIHHSWLSNSLYLLSAFSNDLFGIADLCVTLRDEAGDLLESGQALRDETCLGYWVYLPDVTPPAGTCLIVRAVAKDALGYN